MATLSKTQDITLLTMQAVAANGFIASAAIDVTTKLAVAIAVNIGRDATTALTQGIEVRVEWSPKSTGNDQWRTWASSITGAAAAESEAVTGTENPGATTIEVAATANLVAGDKIFFKNGTLANSEFSRINQISTNTHIIIIDALTRAQTSATVYDQAEFLTFACEFTAVGRYRVMVDGSGVGVAFNVEAFASMCDSY